MSSPQPGVAEIEAPAAARPQARLTVCHSRVRGLSPTFMVMVLLTGLGNARLVQSIGADASGESRRPFTPVPPDGGARLAAGPPRRCPEWRHVPSLREKTRFRRAA